MKRRVPPSSAFSSSTACAMVPVPAKKSSTSDDLSVACSSTRFISLTGFGLSNTLPRSSAARSLVPSSVLPAYSWLQKFVGVSPLASERNILTEGTGLLPSAPQ